MNYDRKSTIRGMGEGYIPEDIQTIRRRNAWQERQMQEELRQKHKRKQERERMRRQKQKRKRIACAVIFLMAGLLVFLLGRLSGYKKYKDEMSSTTFGEPSVQSRELADSDSYESESETLPFLRTYEAKYPETVPKTFTTEEIRDKIHAMAQVDADFQTIETDIEQYPESLLSSLCNNSNMITYALAYNELYGTTSGEIEDCELDGIPLFIQWDRRWGYAPYGKDVVGLSGCGPTCMSMVIVGLTGNKEATPAALADYATEHGYYEPGAGTKWDFMSEAGSAYGIQGTWLPLQKELLYEELEQGHPVICSMRAGDFTAEGHYIVIAGTEDGKLKVNDPNSVKRSSELWDYETLEGQIANLWSYSVAGE